VSGWKVFVLVAVSTACAPSVSDHDNRIFAAPAAMKLSARDLSAAYTADRAGADDRYRGRVIEISGVVENLQPGATALTLAAGDEGQIVEASLHADAAAAVLRVLTGGQRATLKCFCEGFDRRVRLKSCVAPDQAR
jgi:hypothetical protein